MRTLALSRELLLGCLVALSPLQAADGDPGDALLSSELGAVKDRLEEVLPAGSVLSRAALLKLEGGSGLLFHVSPRDKDKAHPSCALFLWPKSYKAACPYTSREGAHTFVRIGDSSKYVVYHSAEFLRKKLVEAFCSKPEG